MAWRPSLRFQTAAIIVVSFLLSHLAGVFYYSLERRDALELTEALDRAERAVDISQYLADIPADRQERFVRFSDTPNLRVWISAEPAVAPSDPTMPESEVADYLRAELPFAADQGVRVRFLEETGSGPTPPPFGRANRPGSPAPPASASEEAPSVAISIQKDDDEWVNFVGLINRSRSLPQGLFFANLISAVIGIALVAFWLVNRVTSPLRHMSRAAETLGRNLFSSPLPVTGPREVAVAAAAFNSMQRRLVRLIRGRTELLAAISHDLRTPLTQIRLRLEMAPETPEREKNLRALDDMDEIIGTFLSYARASHEAEEKSRIDLGALVGTVCDDLADLGAAVDCESPGGLVVSCKRLAIKRALTNLIDNALKYGYEARVRTEHVDDHAVISVEDRGPGIPEAQIEASFTPFHRGESSRSSEAGGVGLGLSIAQAIAEDHGGEVRLTNRSGGGLRAELILPVDDAPAGAARRHFDAKLEGPAPRITFAPRQEQP